MQEVQIREERPGDAPFIEAVTSAAFLEASHTSHTEHHIVRALRTTGKLAVSKVATRLGALIGHVAISPVTVAGLDLGWYGLGPISVLPSHQRCGIGTALIREALRELTALGAAGCVVLGDPGFYGRFGFRPQPGLTLPGVPAEYFMAVAFSGTMPQGLVAYADAFSAQE